MGQIPQEKDLKIEFGYLFTLTFPDAYLILGLYGSSSENAGGLSAEKILIGRKKF